MNNLYSIFEINSAFFYFCWHRIYLFIYVLQGVLTGISFITRWNPHPKQSVALQALLWRNSEAMKFSVVLIFQGRNRTYSGYQTIAWIIGGIVGLTALSGRLLTPSLMHTHKHSFCPANVFLQHNCNLFESQKQSFRATVLQWLLEQHLGTAYSGKFMLTWIFSKCHYLIANYNHSTLNSYQSKYCYLCTISPISRYCSNS